MRVLWRQLWPVMLAVPLTGCGSCVKNTEFYCEAPSDCESGRCDVDHNVCLPPIDGATDAMISSVDAGPDARPIVENYQPADLVLGQPDFVTAGDPGCGQASIRPASVATENGILYVGGFLQSRAVVFSPMPTTSHASATRVLGQSQFTVCTRPATIGQADLWDHAYVGTGGGKVAIGDFFRNRVLIWNPAPTSTNENADLVLGQSDFASSAIGSGASQLNNPSGPPWTDGTRLAVADRGNNRVLIWTSFPTANGQAADLVLGQPAFGMGGAPTTPTAANMKSPFTIWSDGTRLLVADSGQNRVLIWNSFPTTNGQAADVVIGQPNLMSSTAGLSASELGGAGGIAVSGDWLFVADPGNDRVLAFSPFPTSNGEPARYVLGQPDMTTGANNPSPTDQTLDQPDSLATEGQHLWVVDHNHQRVLRFTLSTP